MSRPATRITAAVLVALALSGLIKLYKTSRTTPAPPPAPPAAVRPRTNDLVGTWEPNEAAIVRLSKLGALDPAAPPRLVLRADGYTLARVPYWDRRHIPRLFRASWAGGWNFYGQNDASLYLYGGEVDVRAQVLGERPPYRLSVIVGEPGGNEPLIFTKRAD